MSTSRLEYPPRDWERIQGLGLAPEIFTPETYSRCVALGMHLASATLSIQKEVVPSIDTIKSIHYIAFERVHPWAGTFRKAGQEVQAGSLICSDAKDIDRELAALEKEMLSNPLTGTRKYISEVLGFYHASFLAIHPFLDGNGRISRAILDHQSRKLLGHPLSNNLSKPEYVEGLVRAQQDGNLTKLAKLIRTKDLGKAISVPVPDIKSGIKPRKGAQKSPSRQELIRRERELLSVRRKLGFVGTEIDSEYGLGGFPKPLTENDALVRAKDIFAAGKIDAKNAQELVSEIMIGDRELNKRRIEVSGELFRVRKALLGRRPSEGRGVSLGRKG